MPESQITWNELLEYSRGEGTQQERETIERWISQHPEGDEILSFLSKTDQIEAENKQLWDANAAWDRFNTSYREKSVSKTTRISPQVSRRVGRNSHKKTRTMFNWQYAVAAAVFVIVALFALQQFILTDGIADLEQVYTANNGERVEVVMKDGTQITLNSGSKMWVTTSENRRRVRLKGQAFFDVTPDPERPFTVQTDRATTRVLGTRFEVKSYPESEEVSVVVEHGKVQLTPNNEDSVEKGLILTRNQIGYLHINGSTSRKIVKNAQEYIGWRNGELQFNNQSLKEVVATLERNYDVEISIKEGNLTNSEVGGFTGTFSEKQPVTEVLDAITMVLNLNYQQSKSDDSYILFK